MKIARTALLGATSLAGREVAERLRDGHVAVGEIITCEPGAEASVLSAISGDVVVSTPDVGVALEAADVAIVCVALSADDAARAREAADRGVVILDLAGSLAAPALDPWGMATLDELGAGVHALPAASAVLTTCLLRAARAAGGRAPLVVTCFEPASELGRPALDELYAQALSLLTFTSMPTDVLGKQWAHDVLTPGKDGEDRERRLRREVAALCGESGTSLLVVRAGLFHGSAVAARADVTAAAWKQALAAQKRLEIPEEEDDDVATPATAARAERAVVGRLTDDGAGGSWAFAAADSLAFGAVGGVITLLERATRVQR